MGSDRLKRPRRLVFRNRTLSNLGHNLEHLSSRYAELFPGKE